MSALAVAATTAARDLSADAAVEAVARRDATSIRVTSLALASANGARATLGGPPVRFGAVEMGGRVALGGGGLPTAAIALVRTRGGITGRAVVRPYAVGTARIALTPVAFAATATAARIATTATLSGPLGNGRVEALRLPVEARWRSGQLTVNPACAPLSWRRIAVSGLDLRPARLTLCPDGGAMIAMAGGRPGGGARIAAPRLAGTLGGTPLTLAAAEARFRLGDSSFALGGVAVRLGPAERPTRIAADRIDGRIAGGAVAGSFTGAGGAIGMVPLLLSDAAGRWRLAGGAFALAGSLRVADAAAAPRFAPLASDDVALTLAGNRIEAHATLRHPAKRIEVADVRITHDLARSSGSAQLDVAGITFGDGFQPNELTPVTYGVVADVAGTVAGAGQVAWSQGGVTSSGTFRTDRIDLAAAFGPVTGIQGQIVFTDLFGLVSAPGQVLRVATVNPGIAVENGTVRYRLTGDSRVQVEGGRWPFAGGGLTLDPTLLDFGGDRQRRMTFRVVRADAAAFLQQFDFDNLDATGTFDGVLPMIFDARGGRIADGRLSARTGGTIAYIGTVTQEDVGFWGNLAFQALKSLDYRNLDITMNGPLAGEMVTGIRFAGVSQGRGAKSDFVIRRLAKLPFVFNITVRAPFRQLVDSVRSYYDPSRLIERNLPALVEERQRRGGAAPSIQRSESQERP